MPTARNTRLQYQTVGRRWKSVIRGALIVRERYEGRRARMPNSRDGAHSSFGRRDLLESKTGRAGPQQRVVFTTGPPINHSHPIAAALCLTKSRPPMATKGPPQPRIALIRPSSASLEPLRSCRCCCHRRRLCEPIELMAPPRPPFGALARVTRSSKQRLHSRGEQLEAEGGPHGGAVGLAQLQRRDGDCAKTDDSLVISAPRCARSSRPNHTRPPLTS